MTQYEEVLVMMKYFWEMGMTLSEAMLVTIGLTVGKGLIQRSAAVVHITQSNA